MPKYWKSNKKRGNLLPASLQWVAAIYTWRTGLIRAMIFCMTMRMCRPGDELSLEYM